MAMPFPYVPGTPASLKAFVEAVDEAIAKYGYHKKLMRSWLGSPDYHFYTGMKDGETSASTPSQNMEPNSAKEDEVMAERDQEKEGKRPVRGGVRQHPPTLFGAALFASAWPSTNEATPSDSSRIATLADIERFKADFERRLRKLEKKAFGALPQVLTVNNPVPEWPAERQKLLDLLSRALVIARECVDGSGSEDERKCHDCGRDDCSDCNNRSDSDG